MVDEIKVSADSQENDNKKPTNSKAYKTNKKITKAFLILMSKKSLEEAEVSELCRIAKINRTTFYNHYSSLYELLEYLMDDFFTNIKDYLYSTPYKKENTASKIASVLKYLKENKDFANILLSSNLYEKVAQKLVSFDFIYNIFRNSSNKMINSFIIGEDYYFDFIVAGCLAVIKKWLNEGCIVDENVLARLITSMA